MLTWTSEPPTESGYYWYRRGKGFIPQIVYLLWEGCFFELKPKEPNRLLVMHWAENEIDRSYDTKVCVGEWAGPIPEPEE